MLIQITLKALMSYCWLFSHLLLTRRSGTQSLEHTWFAPVMPCSDSKMNCHRFRINIFWIASPILYICINGMEKVQKTHGFFGGISFVYQSDGIGYLNTHLSNENWVKNEVAQHPWSDLLAVNRWCTFYPMTSHVEDQEAFRCKNLIELPLKIRRLNC